ncbi:hypothetical protein V9K67_21395 [Paraflavisolibacter sp. H34]|uniref:hypothetical protein n=1 Tax=Huijunlia imazamoxiresistens TaxID=3127457 RepID=UPI0030194A69
MKKKKETGGPRIWTATDGRQFLEEAVWRNYERGLLKVPVSTFGEEEIQLLTETVYGYCYDLKGRPSQGMKYRYLVRQNQVLSAFNEDGIYQAAFDVAVECYASPGNFSETRARLETVILYSFTGVGNIVVVPYHEGSGIITGLEEGWKGRVYPVAPVVSFADSAGVLSRLGFRKIWNRKERPVNDMLFAEAWKQLFSCIID